MSKGNKRYKQKYPLEREGRVKDANKKLRGQIKKLVKQIKKLEEENKTLQRSFNKSCQYIDEKLNDKSLEEVLKDIKNFEYKETEKGRKELRRLKEKENSCPDCGNKEGNNFVIMRLKYFNVFTCECGFKKREKSSERVEGS